MRSTPADKIHAARGNTFHRKKARQLTPTHYTGAKADGLEGTSRGAIDPGGQNSRCGERKVRRTATSWVINSAKPPSPIDSFTVLRSYSVLEQFFRIILFQGINSSASQANEDELVGTPHPPLKHNMQKRRNFRLGDVDPK